MESVSNCKIDSVFDCANFASLVTLSSLSLRAHNYLIILTRSAPYWTATNAAKKAVILQSSGYYVPFEQEVACLASIVPGKGAVVLSKLVDIVAYVEVNTLEIVKKNEMGALTRIPGGGLIARHSLLPLDASTLARAP